MKILVFLFKDIILYIQIYKKLNFLFRNQIHQILSKMQDFNDQEKIKEFMKCLESVLLSKYDEILKNSDLTDISQPKFDYENLFAFIFFRSDPSDRSIIIDCKHLFDEKNIKIYNKDIEKEFGKSFTMTKVTRIIPIFKENITYDDLAANIIQNIINILRKNNIDIVTSI